jgi:hypothetical protein
MEELLEKDEHAIRTDLHDSMQPRSEGSVSSCSRFDRDMIRIADEASGNLEMKVRSGEGTTGLRIFRLNSRLNLTQNHLQRLGCDLDPASSPDASGRTPA